jgi:hypothetical protein
MFKQPSLPGVSPEGRREGQRAGTRRRDRPERRGEQVAGGSGTLTDRQKRIGRYRQRERLAGLDPNDAASHWLRKHDPSRGT